MADERQLAGSGSLRPALIAAVREIRKSAKCRTLSLSTPHIHADDGRKPGTPVTASPISWFRSCARRLWALGALVLILVFFSGCWARKQVKEKSAATQQDKSDQASSASDDTAQEASPEPTAAPPSATVHLTYAHRGDYLQSISVAKFASATLLPTQGERPGTALVRFEGGEPVWAIAADRGVSGSLLGHMPGIEENKKFAVSAVTYGNVPKHFIRQEPENSDPEPLEPGKYYIFTVTRGSGLVDYQAVHIGDDGTVESYDAQPRVGTSYQLCCNVAPNFANPAPESGAGGAYP
jgi:hypothetical protein